MTQPISDWLTWQVVDSAFPTGMFAHSCGLESAWQHGEIADPDALGRFLRSSVLQTGFAAIPLINAAYRQPGSFAAFDDLSEAFLINTVANRASRIQGRALMATMMRVWPSDEMAALAEAVRRTRALAAPVTGAAFRTLRVPLLTAQRIALFGAARAVLTAAVRLGIVGSFEAQRLQHGCGPWLDDVAERCADLDADDLAQTAPVIDILQAGHDRLYSRLFQS